MAKIELRISDPKALDRGTNESPVQMTYGDTDSPIVIDTETTLIECEAQSKSAPINQWMVDFGNHKMILVGEPTSGNYQEINNTTAIGMIGQMVQGIGIQCLQKFLSTLTPGDSSPTPGAPAPNNDGDKSPAQPTGNDAPTDDPSELPSPVNPDEI